ncbi:MAG: BlaI/MecI/CopY family transcriptional regulator [Candidatus Brocadiae bacterium]|nr:BlaI/MecI/CopY family transcriptional regulator [Candidatus Brocadiia bacterium]
MAKGKPTRLTPLEALIMDCIWDLGDVTVRQVQERLEAVKPMAYNTVLTMMRILRRKGFLASKRERRTDIYRALVGREQMARRSLDELLDRFFAGSAAALVSELLESEDLSDGEIKAIRREVNAKLRAKGAPKGGAR